MRIIIDAVINTLKKSGVLLNEISDKHLCDNSVPPYFSSIGSHIRHILDFYDCILNFDNNIVDLTLRKRDENVESNVLGALNYLNSIVSRLESLKTEDDKLLIVREDLGTGKIEIQYTLTALLAQANSHTIHHYAIINYILDRMGMNFEDDDFGFNPTTPKS